MSKLYYVLCTYRSDPSKTIHLLSTGEKGALAATEENRELLVKMINDLKDQKIIQTGQIVVTDGPVI